MCIKIFSKITEFFIKVLILILGFMLYYNLTYGLLGSMQEICDNLTQTESVVELRE